MVLGKRVAALMSWNVRLVDITTTYSVCSADMRIEIVIGITYYKILMNRLDAAMFAQ